MCGIAGIVNFSLTSVEKPSFVKKMCEKMSYRGPDAQDVKDFNCASLGHRRLSIIDLSKEANQPMTDASGRYTIVYNGEIYNYKTLQKELREDGINFKTSSDTEVILNGYKKWGVDCVSHFRGMWSFAIWDNVSEELFLSRDRFGEKPLLYYEKDGYLAFASNLAALKPALPEKKIKSSAVASLLSFQYIPHTDAIYENLYKLPPASNLLFSRKGLKVFTYWSFSYKEKIQVSQEEAELHITDLLFSSVEEQLNADVPVGTFLSGGVDSGLITAIAARIKPNITSITMAVPGSGERDESILARRIAEKHKTNHIEVPLDYKCIQKLPFLLSTIEPFGDSSLIPTSAISEVASRYLKVVLTGDGGDELFGGYGKPEIAYQAKKISEGNQRIFVNFLAPIYKFLSYQRISPILRLFRLHATHSGLIASAGLNAYLDTYNATPYQVRKLLYGDKMKQADNNAANQFLYNSLGEFEYNESWEGILGAEIKTRLPGDYLTKVDTASMFHSLETRTPFLDYRILEYVSKLPYNIWKPDQHTKSLLKRVALKFNPRDIVYGPKKGFSIPVESYFLGGWKKLYLKLIPDGVAVNLGLIDRRGALLYLEKHGLRATYRLDRQLFTILALEIWLRVFHEESDAPENLGNMLIEYAKA